MLYIIIYFDNRNIINHPNSKKIMKSIIWQVQRSMSSTTLPVRLLTSVKVNSSHRITLCNPKIRNALSVTMLEHLIYEIEKAGENQSLKSIVINGNGPVFSAGHDLKELIDVKIQQKVFSLATELMSAMLDCPIPIISAIDGLAAASGCQLVAASDIAICTNRSSFSTPGVNLGLFCSTPGIPLSRSIPKKIASYMLFTGESISAKEALRNGLVSKVVHPEELDSEIDKLTLLIDQKSRKVITHGKQFFNQQIDGGIKTVYKSGEKAMLKNLELDDCKEGLQSFIEKRNPNWSN